MKLRTILFALSFIVFNSGIALAQEETQTVLFAQCHFSIPNVTDMLILEENIKSLPSSTLVRLDFNSQRAFILTTGIDTLSNSEFSSWFENFSGTISCIQIGIKGIDQIAKYPFENCNN